MYENIHLKSPPLSKYLLDISPFCCPNNDVIENIAYIEKLAKNKYRLFAGPYSSINTLKNRYFELNKYGFEDLDIKQND